MIRNPENIPSYIIVDDIEDDTHILTPEQIAFWHNKILNMKKKIYIAGKVTGEPIAECTMKFGQMQKELESMGFEVVNPLAVVGDFKAPWQYAMKKCIKAMLDCDGMVILPCWILSPGAKIERQLAEDLDIVICNSDSFGLKVLKAHLS